MKPNGMCDGSRPNQKYVPVECRRADGRRIVVILLLGSNNSGQLGGSTGPTERVAKLSGHRGRNGRAAASPGASHTVGS